MSSTQRIIVLITLDLCFLIFGIHGVVNKKRINNVAHLIISIGQIVSGILLFIGIIILYCIGKL
jgi:TM2 domain-containing membrane protein YozV